MKLFFWAILFFFSSFLDGTEYHVATNGNDTSGDGSLGNPYLTLGKVESILSSNDFSTNGTSIFLHVGYYSDQTIFDSNGSDVYSPNSVATLTISAWGSDKVILGAGEWDDERIRFYTVYSHIQNIIFSNSGGLKYYNAPNGVVSNCSFINISNKDAIYATDSSPLTIVDCDFIDLNTGVKLDPTVADISFCWFENISVDAIYLGSSTSFCEIYSNDFISNSTSINYWSVGDSNFITNNYWGTTNIAEILSNNTNLTSNDILPILSNEVTSQNETISNPIVLYKSFRMFSPITKAITTELIPGGIIEVTLDFTNTTADTYYGLSLIEKIPFNVGFLSNSVSAFSVPSLFFSTNAQVSWDYNLVDLVDDMVTDVKFIFSNLDGNAGGYVKYRLVLK